ncbi:MAG TPA: MDR family MFS transporter [Pseudolabrys sp.]|nr:MDR family MFS transporter [Pseudolabrys sp.]
MNDIPAPGHDTPGSEGASLRVWISVAAGLIGAFMAVLNIQITNASLLDIEGGIGTGVDNGAWISTAYLIGEIIVIPLTDYLSRVFSFRIYLIANAILFLFFSVACAFSANLGQMIALRALQGFSGGVLIPMSFTLVLTKLPKRQQPAGLALFAITATFAPAIGPTIGGYLTENFGWQYVFFVNLVPGCFMVAGLIWTLDAAPMRLGLLKEGDWSGIATMAIGLAALQTVLEEGNKDDWFGSAFIVRLSVIAAVFLTLFIWIELVRAKPLVELRMLLRRNFGLGTLANFLLGFALYGSVFILPQYLGQVHGYNAEQIGSVMAWTGLPQLVIIPFVPKLMSKYDSRLIVSVGFCIFAGSCLMNTHMSVAYAGDQMWIPNIVRAAGQALVLAPLTGVAMIGVAANESGAASGVFNMMRNLGGAFGTAILATIVTKREQYSSNVIGTSVTMFRDSVRERIAHMESYFSAHGTVDPAAAHHQAIVALGKIVRRQSLILGFSYTFAVLGVVLVAAAVLVIMTKKGHASGVAAH